jgi:hypothetical protein
MRANGGVISVTIRDYSAERQAGRAHALRCDCGGWLRIGSHVLTGMTYEACDGPCRYFGKPRPSEDRPLPVSDLERARVRPCVDGCGRKASSGFATRCEECRQRHRLNEQLDHNKNCRWKERHLRDLAARETP